MSVKSIHTQICLLPGRFTFSKCIPVLTSLFLSLLSFAQNENSKWYFGGNVGLDFLTSPPTVLNNGALSTMEGCATISDSNGNLLFYTNGINIYNKNHSIMANGNGLLGNTSTTQSALIVKKPGTLTQYYVFSQGTGTTSSGPLHYSTVDMALAAGLGSVTVKNILLDSSNTEKQIAIRHCNEVDVWIVTHEPYNNNFQTYLLNSNGVNPNAITSYSVGKIHTGGHAGHLSASPDGSKIGACFGYSVELFDFDRSSGGVSNPLFLGTLNFPYGCSFSPDGTKFYAAENLLSANPLHQWDLCAGSTTAIIASQNTVGILAGVLSTGCMQRAIDGKIYITRYFSSDLAVINNPNAYGTACNFVNLGLSLGAKTCRFGLQNIINDFIRPVPTNCYSHLCGTITTAPDFHTSHATPKIYPNPVIEELNIDYDMAFQYSLWNSLGELIANGTTEPGNFKISFQFAASGCYTLRLSNNGGDYFHKVIKSD